MYQFFPWSTTCHIILLLLFSLTLWPHELQHARLPYLHYLPEFAQTHVHWVNDAIQLSHPLHPLLLPPSVFSSIRLYSNESALHVRRPKFWSFSFSISPSNIQGCFPLGLTGLISLLSKGLSRVCSSTTVQTHQFFGAQPSLWSVSHIHIWLLEKP